MSSCPTSAQPPALAGLTILDLSRFLPGPYCSLLLADLGADVLRIEQPAEVRKREQVLGLVRLPESERARLRAGEMIARNKRSVLLNLRRPSGRAALLKLARSADVLLHDYRPGVLESGGLGFEALHAANPRLVYCSVSLAGESGAHRDLPGHDPIALALAGALPRFGAGAGAPAIPGLPVSDIPAGLHAAVGILAALRARETSGLGQHVQVAMADTAYALMMPVFQRFLGSGREPPHGWPVGNVGVWQTRDGRFICTTDLEPQYWQRFCEAVGRPDLLGRQFDADRDALVRELRVLFASRDRDEWLRILRTAGTQVAPVRDTREALDDPAMRERGALQTAVSPEGIEAPHVSCPIRLGGASAPVRRTACAPGAHTREVLLAHGFDEREIHDVEAECA